MPVRRRAPGRSIPAAGYSAAAPPLLASAPHELTFLEPIEPGMLAAIVDFDHAGAVLDDLLPFAGRRLRNLPRTHQLVVFPNSPLNDLARFATHHVLAVPWLLRRGEVTWGWRLLRRCWLAPRQHPQREDDGET